MQEIIAADTHLTERCEALLESLRSELAILNADGLTEILGSSDEGMKASETPLENKMTDELGAGGLRVNETPNSVIP